jgi:regulator of sigma E protease
MITLLAFILTLGVLIIVHEYGHYRVAVACGVKVDRFSIGFGRVLWRRQATPDSTEFVVSALPLGGYVRWVDDQEGGVRPGQEHLTFRSKSLGKRTAIVAAGPVANLALAVLLYATANWIGIDEPKALLAAPPAASVAERAGIRAGDWARASSSDGGDWRELRSMTDLRWEITQAVLHGEPLQLRVTDSAGRGEHEVMLPLDRLAGKEIDAQLMQSIGLGQPYSEPVIARVEPGGAAEKAGVRAGDRVLSIDNQPIPDSARVQELMRNSAAHGTPPPMTWRVERAGQTIELQVTPAVVEANGKRIGRAGVGVGQMPQMVLVRYGLVEGLTQAARRTWEMSALTLKMFGRMIVGTASLKNVSGPLTIAEYAGQSVKLGLAYYLGFLAIVSVSLGVLNLLPLPVLDGGYLMYYLFEAVTGRPVSDEWLGRLQRGGLAIVVLMMSLALYNDVARLLGLQ